MAPLPAKRETVPLHSTVLLPKGAPAAYRDRGTLWNVVEARERQRNSQLAREVEFALPWELTQSQSVALALAYVQAAFVSAGMVADLNVH